MNTITIVGNIGKDAEVKQFEDRYKISFSVATNEKRKAGDRTDWHNVAYWSSSDKVAPYLKKGQQVAINGAQRTDKMKDGGYYSYIDAYKLELIGKANTTADNSGNDEQFPF